jgi:hypothetical protein
MRFLMSKMKTVVSDYRDYEIAHEKSNRSRGLLIPPREFGGAVITAVDPWKEGVREIAAYLRGST